MSSTSDLHAIALLNNATATSNAPATMQGSSRLHAGLKNMEESLSCVVCRDIFRNPISLYPCQHSFCSECVRKSLKEQLKSLKRTANCPVCRVQLDTTGTAFEKCIRPNPTLEDLSKAYSSTRNELYSVLSSASTTTAAATAAIEGEPPRRSSRRSTESAENNGTQAPPLPPPQQAPPQQHRLTKKNPVLYSSFKKKQLQELCRKEGLATHGSDTELKLRHQAFVELYNAECDSSTPRTHAELIQDFAHREQQRRLVESQDRSVGAHQHAAHVERFFQQRNGLSSIMRGDSEFDQEWKDGWKRLIELGREQLDKERAQKKQKTTVSDKKMDADAPAEPTSENDNGVETFMQESKATQVEERKSVVSVNNNPGTSASMTNLNVLSNDTPVATETKLTSLSRDNQENQLNVEVDAFSLKPFPSFASHVTKRPFDLTRPLSSAASVSDASPSGMQIAVPNDDSIWYQPAKQPRLFEAPSVTRTSARSIVGPWTCTKCTYLNTTRTWSTARCEICETSRQSPVQTHELITLN